MKDLQDRIADLHQATRKGRQDLTRRAWEAYSQSLVQGGSTPIAAKTATTVAQTLLKDRLLGEDWSKLLNPSDDSASPPAGTLALGFDAMMPPLDLPAPVTSKQPSLWSRALAALIGSIAGLLILTPVAKLALDMRDVGLFLGGPVGAMLGVLVSGRLGRLHRWLRAKPSTAPYFDRQGHEQLITTLIDQWLQLAVITLYLLTHQQKILQEGDTDQAQVFKRLSRRTYDLFHATAEQLPVAADELIQEARNSGFTGLDGNPTFWGETNEREEITWKDSLSSHYEPFGHIEAGDLVRVERKPVMLGDQVVVRGLVRKVRS